MSLTAARLEAEVLNGYAGVTAVVEPCSELVTRFEAVWKLAELNPLPTGGAV